MHVVLLERSDDGRVMSGWKGSVGKRRVVEVGASRKGDE